LQTKMWEGNKMAFKTQCPKGHNSTDPDYCSECGARIGESALPETVNKVLVTAPVTSVNNEICPDCGTLRVADSRFCEVCRYDFQSKVASVIPDVPIAQPAASSEPLAPTPPPPPLPPQPSAILPPAPAVAAAPISATLAVKLNAVVLVDPSLITDDSMRASCPQGVAERVFPLDLAENLVGRRSDSKGIYPEVEVNDLGVSHRHLKLSKQADGSFTVLELGSANGTELNGTPLEAGVSTPVKAGDEFVIGMWTRLQIRAR